MANDYLSDEKRELDIFEAMKRLPLSSSIFNRKRSLSKYILWLNNRRSRAASRQIRDEGSVKKQGRLPGARHPA